MIASTRYSNTGRGLQPQRLDHRQHSHLKAAPRRAVAAEGVLPPQHAHAEDVLDMIVRRLDSLDRCERLVPVAKVSHHRRQPRPDDMGPDLGGDLGTIEQATARATAACPWCSVRMAANGGISAP